MTIVNSAKYWRMILLSLNKSVDSKIGSILLSSIALTLSHSCYAWEAWEQRLINKGCWQFEEKKVNPEFMRCFQYQLTNIYPGQITKVQKSSSSVIGCASNKDSKWCDLHLVSNDGAIALSIALMNDPWLTSKSNKFALNNLIINVEALGDICNCKVKEWGIETDDSLYYSANEWNGKEATPVIQSIKKTKRLTIFASIPNAYKTKYRLEFTDGDLVDFKRHLIEAINYTEMGN